jgi:hypothetical protein
MIRLFKIILIGLAVITFSCKNKKRLEVEIDKPVMKEIFPSLIDSMYVEVLFALRPPPVEEVYDSISGKTVLRSIAKTIQFKEQIRNELAEQKKDSAIVTIVINDSIHPLAEDEKLKFQSKHVLSDNIFGSGYKTDLDTKIIPGFKIVLSSQYKPTDAPLDKVLKEFSFSRVVFDKDQNIGITTCEYVCGGLCGNGYRIFIKKVHNKWTVDYIEQAWIA